ncbi:MAG: methyltransferase domain-containing protein [Deltaproteobacteria bacterium]|nr:methyltransferase domain-containing protein [Deltaproteobacteria bacterium]
MTLPRPEELACTPVELAGHTLQVWHIRDLDAFLARLLDEHPVFPDDDIPYYAWIWPSARVLAEALLAGPPLDGVSAVELGCGTGMVGVAAAVRGAQVTLTDLQEGALELARRNAQACGTGARVTVARLDWRQPHLAPVPLLLCSDVLYEARLAEPLAACVAALLAPGGTALLADPSRPHFGRFVDAAARQGLEVETGPVRPTPEGADVRLYAVRRPGEVHTPRWAWDTGRVERGC